MTPERMLTTLMLLLLAAAGSGIVAAQAPDLEPGVQTSPAATPGAATLGAANPVPPAAKLPARMPAPAAALAATPANAAATKDRVQLDTTQISGNRELPRVMYVVPWRRPDPGEFSGRPPNSLLDEALTPVDRDVFRRQNRYYSALSGEPGAPNSQPGAAATGVATPTPKDEK